MWCACVLERPCTCESSGLLSFLAVFGSKHSSWQINRVWSTFLSQLGGDNLPAYFSMLPSCITLFYLQMMKAGWHGTSFRTSTQAMLTDRARDASTLQPSRQWPTRPMSSGWWCGRRTLPSSLPCQTRMSTTMGDCPATGPWTRRRGCSERCRSLINLTWPVKERLTQRRFIWWKK